MSKRLTIAECIILIIGVMISISGTIKAVSYSTSYIPYFAFAVLGIVFTVVLFILRSKRFTFLAGIGMIFFYLIFAGFAYIVCSVNAQRMRRLEYYSGKEVVLYIGDDRYDWTGEGFYQSENLEPVDVSDKDAYVTIDGEVRNEKFVYMMPGDENTVYYDIYSGCTGDYLVMEKSS